MLALPSLESSRASLGDRSCRMQATQTPAAAEQAPAPSSAVSVGEDGAITSRVFARIGLLGNPSDGFFGKTISLSLANFYAEVCCFSRSRFNRSAELYNVSVAIADPHYGASSVAVAAPRRRRRRLRCRKALGCCTRT